MKSSFSTALAVSVLGLSATLQVLATPVQLPQLPFSLSSSPFLSSAPPKVNADISAISFDGMGEEGKYPKTIGENMTIYEIITVCPAFSKVKKLVDMSESVKSRLSGGGDELSFFALPVSRFGIPFRR